MNNPDGIVPAVERPDPANAVKILKGLQQTREETASVHLVGMFNGAPLPSAGEISFLIAFALAMVGMVTEGFFGKNKKK